MFRDVSYPNEVVSMDFIGPIPMGSVKGYILVMVDHLTRKVALLHTNDASQHTVLRGIRRWESENGKPEICFTDGGPGFKGNNVHYYCAQKGIRVMTSLPYLHRSNGVTERVNRTILMKLRKTDYPDTEWANLLPFVETCYNETPHSIIGEALVDVWNGDTEL
ncbi:hypothetical protein BSKO_12481 [Bryopsis sp. KO-2023]|nr:hypothetical protein BSKO_12481 [Bryopsis sp. KO-2023]